MRARSVTMPRVSHYNRLIVLDEGDGTSNAPGAIIRGAGDELTSLDSLDIPCREHGNCIHDVPPSRLKLPWSQFRTYAKLSPPWLLL
jgi:hypothetical protein